MKRTIRFMNIEQTRKKLRRCKKQWAELAGSTGISISTIRRVAETEGYLPSLRTLEALMAGLERFSVAKRRVTSRKSPTQSR